MRSRILVATSVGAVVVLATAWTYAPAASQTTVSADGLIESTTGGFRFSNGSLQTTALVGVAPVEDSGQRTCWNAAGAEVACQGTGQDGALQPGVAFPTPRLVANGDGTVTDTMTGLVWLESANCLFQGWDAALASANALADGICGLADDSGVGDWRLPNVKELLSLIDYGESQPALTTDPFSGAQSATYWTSTTAVSGPINAFGVDLADGDDSVVAKSSSLWVLPVRNQP